LNELNRFRAAACTFSTVMVRDNAHVMQYAD